MQEGHRDPHALALAHRHAVEASPSELLEFEASQRLLDVRVAVARFEEREARPVEKVLADRHPRVETRVARREQSDAPLVGAPGSGRLEATNDNAPGVWGDDSGDDP